MAAKASSDAKISEVKRQKEEEVTPGWDDRKNLPPLTPTEAKVALVWHENYKQKKDRHMKEYEVRQRIPYLERLTGAICEVALTIPGACARAVGEYSVMRCDVYVARQLLLRELLSNEMVTDNIPDSAAAPKNVFELLSVVCEQSGEDELVHLEQQLSAEEYYGIGPSDGNRWDAVFQPCIACGKVWWSGVCTAGGCSHLKRSQIVLYRGGAIACRDRCSSRCGCGTIPIQYWMSQCRSCHEWKCRQHEFSKQIIRVESDRQCRLCRERWSLGGVLQTILKSEDPVRAFHHYLSTKQKNNA